MTARPSWVGMISRPAPFLRERQEQELELSPSRWVEAHGRTRRRRAPTEVSREPLLRDLVRAVLNTNGPPK